MTEKDPGATSSRNFIRSSAIFITFSVSLILRGLKALLILALLLWGLTVVLSGFSDAKRFPWVERAATLEAEMRTPPINFIKSHLPTDFRGRDVSVWILLGGALVIWGGLGMVESYVTRYNRELGERNRETEPEPQGIVEPLPPSPILVKKTDKYRDGKLARSELLEIYAQTKMKLERHKKARAFLAIDIVDSTGLKVGEDAGIAERDFRQYKLMVERALKANNALKSAWTPDGVMTCFKLTADAVRAAQKVIVDLDEFNRTVKVIKRDFAIRAGIHSGEVFDDDETPMEEMTDRVIDIAGHMQKHGAVNSICVSEDCIKPLLGDFTFAPASRTIDDCPVYEWRRSPAEV